MWFGLFTSRRRICWPGTRHMCSLSSPMRLTFEFLSFNHLFLFFFVLKKLFLLGGPPVLAQFFSVYFQLWFNLIKPVNAILLIFILKNYIHFDALINDIVHLWVSLEFHFDHHGVVCTQALALDPPPGWNEDAIAIF
jgi:hypothetical protein